MYGTGNSSLAAGAVAESEAGPALVQGFVQKGGGKGPGGEAASNVGLPRVLEDAQGPQDALQNGSGSEMSTSTSLSFSNTLQSMETLPQVDVSTAGPAQAGDGLP